jgi:S-DNA-T family DNA segregation ATPase FtsK/SpoIIIE
VKRPRGACPAGGRVSQYAGGGPHAAPASVTAQRHLLWQARPAATDPPAVFAGYAEHHIAEDPLYAALSAHVRRRHALVGRAVDVGLPTIGFGLDAVPGRHLAVLGTSPVGADILRAATPEPTRQHQPGTARFLLAAFADPIVDDLVATPTAGGHDALDLDAGQLRAHPAAADHHRRRPGRQAHTYLVNFAADVVVPMLSGRGPDRRPAWTTCALCCVPGPGHGCTWLVAHRPPVRQPYEIQKAT